ncbi:MAG TPA: hypothetical protein VMO17_04725 [Terriglobia bacterium]|nr:hypothetical protein [Terriglobia bacterium]
MNLNPRWRWVWRAGAVLLILFLSQSAPGASKTKGAKGGGGSDLSYIIRPELVNAQTNPTLRFPIMSAGGSVFSITYGFLDISESTVRYTVVQPGSKSSHSFQAPRNSLNNIRFGREWLTFKAPKQTKTLIYLPQDRWGSVHTGPGMGAAASRESLGTSSIYKTLLNFEGVLALVKPPPPPAPVVAPPVAPAPTPKPPPPSPPALVLSSPPAAGTNQPVEVEEPTVTIRGVAMDRTGIPVVKINGSPVSMRPQTSEAAEFWSEPIRLQSGDNPIHVVASNSAQMETRLDLVVRYKPKAVPVNPQALGKEDILSLLQGGVPPTHIADVIKQRGIKFSPSADDVKVIREAGGTDELIDAIQQAAPHP